MSKYFFSAVLLCCSLLLHAQDEVKTDTTIVPKKERYGLRVGTDLYKLTRSFYDSNYKGIEFSGDYRITRKYYFAAEIGNENKTTEEDYLNFTTKGSFVRFGFDYNAHENWLDLENMLYLGLRYGISSFSQELNSYKIYNPNPYFGQGETVPVGDKFSGLSAQWLEVVAGLKAQVFKNVFVGFSFRMNKLFSNKKPGGFDNLYIPGFNRTYAGDFGFGFNYSVSYMLPLYKKQVKMDEKQLEAAKKKKKGK